MNQNIRGLLEELKYWGADEKERVLERVGPTRFSALVRWDHVREYALEGYEIVVLGRRGRRALGMGDHQVVPQSAVKRFVRRCVLETLQREGWSYIGAVSRTVCAMRSPEDREVLVLVAHDASVHNVQHNLSMARQHEVLIFHAHPSRLKSLRKYRTEIRLLSRTARRPR